jgi:hypothetical protein
MWCGPSCCVIHGGRAKGQKEPLMPNYLLKVPPLSAVTIPAKIQNEFWREHSNHHIQVRKEEVALSLQTTSSPMKRFIILNIDIPVTFFTEIGDKRS